jgi:hypothetical protein
MEELITISTDVSFNVAIGINKYHDEYNVEILEFKGLSEDYTWVSVRGTMDNLKALNDKATDYKPTVTRASNQ